MRYALRIPLLLLVCAKFGCAPKEPVPSPDCDKRDGEFATLTEWIDHSEFIVTGRISALSASNTLSIVITQSIMGNLQGEIIVRFDATAECLRPSPLSDASVLVDGPSPEVQLIDRFALLLVTQSSASDYIVRSPHAHELVGCAFATAFIDYPVGYGGKGDGELWWRRKTGCGLLTVPTLVAERGLTELVRSGATTLFDAATTYL